MNPVEKSSVNALAAALKAAQNTESEVGDTETVADFVNILLAEPDGKKRKAMMKDFSARRKDAAKFLKDNEALINAEAEAALIKAAVGGTQTEKVISYKGGRKQVTEKKTHISPNPTALQFLLKNRMPDKYSDKPAGDIEIEDVSEIEEALYGNKDEKDDPV